MDMLVFKVHHGLLGTEVLHLRMPSRLPVSNYFLSIALPFHQSESQDYSTFSLQRELELGKTPL